MVLDRTVDKGAVKVMLSYDYCHFEIQLSIDTLTTLKDINELRKDAHRLAVEAVRQYVVAKRKASDRANLQFEKQRLQSEIRVIRQKPEKEWTAEEKAKVRALEDHAYWSQHDYDYEDNGWEESNE